MHHPATQRRSALEVSGVRDALVMAVCSRIRAHNTSTCEQCRLRRYIDGMPVTSAFTVFLDASPGDVRIGISSATATGEPPRSPAGICSTTDPSPQEVRKMSVAPHRYPTPPNEKVPRQARTCTPRAWYKEPADRLCKAGSGFKCPPGRYRPTSKHGICDHGIDLRPHASPGVDLWVMRILGRSLNSPYDNDYSRVAMTTDECPFRSSSGQSVGDPHVTIMPVAPF
jgi:hypothetical protein